MPSNRQLRAALYTRVSTTGHGQDAALQRDALRHAANARGWQIVAEHTDAGESGTKRDRPELAKVMQLARSRTIDVVAVWRFDRFARSTSHLLEALDEFRRLGVDFVSLREQIDTSTPMGKAMFTITAAVAELERDLIRERVQAGVDRAKAAGKHCGRPLRAIDLSGAERLLAEGVGVRQAARMVNLPEATLRRRLAALRQKPIGEDAA